MKKNEWVTKKDIVWFMCILTVLILARMFLFSSIEVHGESMSPTLENKERIIGLKVGTIERFDIVSFEAPTEPDESKKNYIKRIIGLPGEEIEYKEDQLYINGEPLEESFLEEFKQQLEAKQQLTEDFSYSVPENSYFVMGDNRRNSKDSRMIGAISEDKIDANAKFTFWPVNKIGTTY